MMATILYCLFMTGQSPHIGIYVDHYDGAVPAQT